MNLEFSEYWIDYNGSEYLLLKDGEEMCTPAGNSVKYHNRSLVEHIAFELECETSLDLSQLSTYTLYSAMVDMVQSHPKEEYLISRDVFRSMIINDPVLRACAGPESIQQRRKWGDLFEDLELLGMKYPDIIQSPITEEIEEWIESNGENYVESINNFVDHYFTEFNLLSDPQKVVVINSAHIHDSLIYAILLASKKCTELNYITALLAGYCMLPNIFADVDKEEYKEAFEGLKSDAHIFTNFIDCCLSPDIKLSEYVKEKVPNWSFLPEGSRIALTEGLSKINLAKSEDYSPYVMLLGKSIEIALKESVFDEFQVKFNYFFQEEIDVKVFIQDNEVIEKLARYLIKEPHFIELGSMLFILEKHGGKTASKNEVLSKLFGFIVNDLKKPQVVSKDWVNLAKSIRDHRNRAAHSERYSLDEAKKVENLALNILKAF